MENSHQKTRNMVKIATIAAIYTVLTIVISPLAYGAVQFRVSEVLTVLPAFSWLAVPGLTLGCCLSNLVGAFTGMNPTGYMDAVIGSCATLVSALISFGIHKKCKHRIVRYLLVPLPAVLVNAVIIGIELTYLYSDTLIFNMLSVGIGQFVICYALGVPFMIAMERNDFYKKIFS